MEDKIDSRQFLNKPVEVIEEECRLNLVKSIVDAACSMIVSGAISHNELNSLRAFTRKSALNFIPGQEELYDMIYDKRLDRYINQFDYKNNPNLGTS